MALEVRDDAGGKNGALLGLFDLARRVKERSCWLRRRAHKKRVAQGCAENFANVFRCRSVRIAQVLRIVGAVEEEKSLYGLASFGEGWRLVVWKVRSENKH